MAKLTKAQCSFLDGLVTGQRFLTGKSSIMSPTANALRKHGLVDWKPGHSWGGSWYVTNAGRAALQSHNEGSAGK